VALFIPDAAFSLLWSVWCILLLICLAMWSDDGNACLHSCML